MTIETQVPYGSITAVTSSIKAFAITHPASLSFSVGVLVGLTIYHKLCKRSKNKKITS